MSSHPLAGSWTALEEAAISLDPPVVCGVGGGEMLWSASLTWENSCYRKTAVTQTEEALVVKRIPSDIDRLRVVFDEESLVADAGCGHQAESRSPIRPQLRGATGSWYSIWARPGPWKWAEASSPVGLPCRWQSRSPHNLESAPIRAPPPPPPSRLGTRLGRLTPAPLASCGKPLNGGEEWSFPDGTVSETSPLFVWSRLGGTCPGGDCRCL